MQHTTSQPTEALSTINNFLVQGRLQEMADAIDTLIQQDGDMALLEVNKLIAQPFKLSVLIHYTLNNVLAFEQVLSESYYHENGFHKIVLLAGRHFKLRLHHFGTAAKIPMENVHDHRWAFASTVLRGTLKMQLLEANQPVGEELLHYLYNSNKSCGSYGLDLQGKTKVAVMEVRQYEPGDQYLMLPHELHRILNGEGEESITLILTGNPIKQTCNLYAKRKIKEVEQKTISYPRETMVQMLKELSEKIYPILN